MRARMETGREREKGEVGKFLLAQRAWGTWALTQRECGTTRCLPPTAILRLWVSWFVCLRRNRRGGRGASNGMEHHTHSRSRSACQQCALYETGGERHTPVLSIAKVKCTRCPAWNGHRASRRKIKGYEQTRRDVWAVTRCEGEGGGDRQEGCERVVCVFVESSSAAGGY